MSKKDNNFTNWVHNFGIISSIILLLLMCSLPVIVSMVFGIWPNFAKLWPAILTLILMLAPWWPAEYFGYMTTMGPGALYMSYITGNVTNLKMPATIGTINTLGLEPNTDKCHTMAIIACGASNITTLLILFLGVLFIVPLTPILQAEALQPAFNYALPALFGGLAAQSILKGKKQVALYAITLLICLALFRFTAINAAYCMLITVGVGALVFYLFDYKLVNGKDNNN